ncbi:Pentatricopeptide repeat [Macleaya cordata]|uniref:Pentatricopeptide repeat n=1 Tax=Macleaya cordata TaxID=56857 RepID=A0A200Q455_MACCD|nr:Pentatricopeptide repeat [Macleaya cordata]
MVEQLLSLALNRCTNQLVSSLAKTVHSNALKIGVLSNLHFATRVLVAYCKCGVIDDARKLFDEIAESSYGRQLSFSSSSLDAVCWNSIISGCVNNRRDKEAFQYFKQMQQSYYYNSFPFNNHNSDDDLEDFIGPDSYTLSSLLSSNYCLQENIIPGQQLHGYTIKSGNFSNFSVGNALITLYTRWCRLYESKLVFQSMPRRNIVSWTALISGYARQRDHEEESLKLFVLMMKENEQRPNQFTFASIFGSCGRLASLSQGIPFISTALKMGFLSDIHVQNSLVGFYSECGCIEEAITTFKAIINPDLVSWNSLLKGYSQQGRGNEALQVFEEMQARGENPDAITFLSTISACRHTGMVSQGLQLFRSMKLDYRIEQEDEHISCVVDLLGRAGRLDQAEDFIRGIKFDLSPSVWRTLLGACKIHGRTDELVELAASKLLELEPSDTEAHIVLSHIYATKRQWDMVANFRRSFKEKGGSKDPGCSWIEVQNSVHSFVAGDSGHPLIDEIQTTLIELTNKIKQQTVEILLE